MDIYACTLGVATGLSPNRKSLSAARATKNEGYVVSARFHSPFRLYISCATGSMEQSIRHVPRMYSRGIHRPLLPAHNITVASLHWTTRHWRKVLRPNAIPGSQTLAMSGISELLSCQVPLMWCQSGGMGLKVCC